MAKKPGNSGSNVPSDRAGTAIGPARERSLNAVKSQEPEPGVVHDGDTTLVSGRPYATHGDIVPIAEIYYVQGLKPNVDGPWLGEADKIAWRDPATGYECIIMRATHGGYLSGYVGVPRSHPLYGFEHEAVPPELGVEVHGGLTYSRICEDGPAPERRRIDREARRICHVPRNAGFAPLSHATGYRVEDAHAWWFGFDCNHAYDVVPNDPKHGQQYLGAEIGQVYRDDAYVLREVTNLASQLHAIASGDPIPPRAGSPLPPVGLEPTEGG